MDRSKYLAWIDLEMTGLDSTKDVILEVASMITDSNLNVIAEGPEIVINQPAEKLRNLDIKVQHMHQNSGLLDLVLKSKIDLASAEQETLDFFSLYEQSDVMPLCGNSIWQDKMFLIHHMPSLVKFFHYRIIDVSSIKEVVHRWYSVPEFEKSKGHRALSDIRESIAELKYYRRNFFVK